MRKQQFSRLFNDMAGARAHGAKWKTSIAGTRVGTIACRDDPSSLHLCRLLGSSNGRLPALNGLNIELTNFRGSERFSYNATRLDFPKKPLNASRTL